MIQFKQMAIDFELEDFMLVIMCICSSVRRPHLDVTPSSTLVHVIEVLSSINNCVWG